MNNQPPPPPAPALLSGMNCQADISLSGGAGGQRELTTQWHCLCWWGAEVLGGNTSLHQPLWRDSEKARGPRGAELVCGAKKLSVCGIWTFVHGGVVLQSRCRVSERWDGQTGKRRSREVCQHAERPLNYSEEPPGSKSHSQHLPIRHLPSLSAAAVVFDPVVSKSRQTPLTLLLLLLSTTMRKMQS